jgi:hypothetical protein
MAGMIVPALKSTETSSKGSQQYAPLEAFRNALASSANNNAEIYAAAEGAKVNTKPKSAFLDDVQLRNVYREIVGCPPESNCAWAFRAPRLTNYLLYTPYRDPTRRGNPKFNFSDMNYLYSYFGIAFGVLSETPELPGDTKGEQLKAWIYKDQGNSKLEKGVGDRKLPLIPLIEGDFYSTDVNQMASDHNKQYPDEVDISEIVASTIPFISQNDEWVDPKEFMDYMRACRK